MNIVQLILKLIRFTIRILLQVTEVPVTSKRTDIAQKTPRGKGDASPLLPKEVISPLKASLRTNFEPHTCLALNRTFVAYANCFFLRKNLVT